uniref:Uncharacterized protein n=1 Tax=Arundo donax TaxID=35708 RepID=A0A0A9CBY5_ARUDO
MHRLPGPGSMGRDAAGPTNHVGNS